MRKLIRRILDGEQQLLQRYNEAVIGAKDGLADSRTLPAYMRGRVRAMRFLVNHAGMSVSDGLVLLMHLCLQNGDVFIDAGTNIGEYSWQAASLVGPKGNVHCFEPSPSTLRLLRDRITKFGLKNVHINEVALGDKTGTVTLHVFDEALGAANSLASNAWPGHQHADEVEVPITTLDDYILENRVGPIRLIKIDVQGAERDLLRGAEQTLTRSAEPPILHVELEDCTCKAFGYTINDLLSQIWGFGYKTFSLRPEGMVELCSENDMPSDSTHDDVVCLNPASHGPLIARLRSLAAKR